MHVPEIFVGKPQEIKKVKKIVISGLKNERSLGEIFQGIPTVDLVKE